MPLGFTIRQPATWFSTPNLHLRSSSIFVKLSLPYGHLWQCCDTREVPPGRLGDVERKDCLAVDVLPVVPDFAIGQVGPLASVTGEEPKSLKEAFKVPAIDGRHVPQSIYLHSSFSQCLSTATKRTPALLLRQPKCHQAVQSLTSSGQEGVPRRCPVQHFYLSSHTRE
ncbi:hypothetical protein MHYP_G00029650 [Metynnis hypsauchen]